VSIGLLSTNGLLCANACDLAEAIEDGEALAGAMVCSFCFVGPRTCSGLPGAGAGLTLNNPFLDGHARPSCELRVVPSQCVECQAESSYYVRVERAIPEEGPEEDPNPVSSTVGR
jgi:hypothetical protein